MKHSLIFEVSEEVADLLVEPFQRASESHDSPPPPTLVLFGHLQTCAALDDCHVSRLGTWLPDSGPS